MNIKPFRQYAETDVVNGFALNIETGNKGAVVLITGSGFNSTDTQGLYGNLTNRRNVYSAMWHAKPKVALADSTGVTPFGLLLWDVLKQNEWGDVYRYDETRKAERQAVVSGDATPILRRGYVLVGPWTGNPTVGQYVIPSGAGEMAISATKTSNSFGKFLGPKDSDHYALVYVDFGLL